MEQDKPNGVGWPTASSLIRMLRPHANKHFAAIYLLGMVTDLVAFRALIAVGANTELSQAASFMLGAIIIFALTIRPSLAQPDAFGGAPSWKTYGRFTTVSLPALFLRSAVLLLLIRNWQWQPETAIPVAILLGAIVLFIGSAFFVFPERWSDETPALRWQLATIVIVAYVLVLKLPFMALVELIPEEAYYWNYAQHLDLSYLDHPPMVAWLIWLSTSVLGKSELSVRLPAFICSIIAALFMFRLTVNLFDRAAAVRAILLLAVLPIYFGLGFFMTPDVPQYAAWAGCLYFLERALLGENKAAWWGVGISMGLGMLSKYTTALLGLGTLIFVLADKQSRRWLLRPEPYFAAILALAFFTPVLIWNMNHDWISFVFQGPDRWASTPKFYLHILFGSILLLLTPIGFLGLVRALQPQNMLSAPDTNQSSAERRRYLWVLTFTLVPLSVFVIHSLRNQIKLNWTAPVWLAVIPYLAWDMMPRAGEITGSLAKLIRRSWMPTIIVLLIIHGAAFYYVSLGLPGTGPVVKKPYLGPWRLLGDKVQAIEAGLKAQTKSEPILVGMDNHFISSELSFYDFVDNDATFNTGGPHLFGGHSVMFAFWLPPAAAAGRNFLMIDFDRKRLGDRSLSRFFDSTSEVFPEVLEKNGQKIGYFYWRVGYNYNGRADSPKNVRKNLDPNSLPHIAGAK
jgi:dolichol-phosphate mannosyltransferase